MTNISSNIIDSLPLQKAKLDSINLAFERINKRFINLLDFCCFNCQNDEEIYFEQEEKVSLAFIAEIDKIRKMRDKIKFNIDEYIKFHLEDVSTYLSEETNPSLTKVAKKFFVINKNYEENMQLITQLTGSIDVLESLCKSIFK